MDSQENKLMDLNQAIPIKLAKTLNNLDWERDVIELYRPQLDKILREKLRFADSTNEIKEKIQEVLDKELELGNIKCNVIPNEENIFHRKFIIQLIPEEQKLDIKMEIDT